MGLRSSFPSDPSDLSFQDLIDALLDTDHPFPPRFLYRLSDLERNELSRLKTVWDQVPAWRRKALMEDVEMLGERDNLLSFEELALFAVTDPDPQVRLPAVRTLWVFESRSLIPLFLNLLQNDEDTLVRAAAASALGRFVYQGELEELSSELHHQIEDRLLQAYHSDETQLIKRRALESLGFSSRDDVPALIETALQHSDLDWVVSALVAIGRSADESWQPLVLQRLDSQHPAIRAEAARAAGELELQAARPRLFELLNDSDTGVVFAAIWSLSQLGGEGVRPALEKMHTQADDEALTEWLEDALDNLSFTEDVNLYSIFDLPSVEDGNDDLNLGEDVFEDDLSDLNLFEDDEEF